MDKLSVGIVLEPSYEQTAGGGFSYYTTLVNHIDAYEFNADLDIKFISWNQIKYNRHFTKTVVDINPEDFYQRKDKIRKRLILVLQLKFFKIFPFIKRLSSKFNRTQNYINQKNIEAGIAKNQIDLIYHLIPGGGFLNYPCILTHWDNGHLSMHSFPEVSLNKIFEEREKYFRINLMKAFAVFCESNSGKKELVKYTSINPERVYLVPLFPSSFSDLDVSYEEQVAILTEYALRTNKFFFYPAQFWARKNHYNLLIAFQNLLRQYPDIKLCLSGSDQGNMDYIRTVIKFLNLEESVVITGFVSKEAIASFYTHAIALVMPTFLGPTNMPLLEALEFGCPVICSDLEGHYELLGDQASYIQPGEPLSIYRALEKHINNSYVESRKRSAHPIFNVQNAIKEIEKSLLKLKPVRKTFGYNIRRV